MVATAWVNARDSEVLAPLSRHTLKPHRSLYPANVKLLVLNRTCAAMHSRYGASVIFIESISETHKRKACLETRQKVVLFLHCILPLLIGTAQNRMPLIH